MQGSFSQAGFFYQNHIAASKVLELLDFGTASRTITLENYAKGNHIDDIIIEYGDFTRYYQVKWSVGDDSPYTIYNLTTPQGDKPNSLFRELAEGYERIPNRENAEIILVSTKVASNNKRPSEGISQGLADHIRDIHSPFIETTAPSDLRLLPNYNKYESVIQKLIRASELDEGTFNNFFKRLRFQLGQPGTDVQREYILRKLEVLGIERRLYDTLLNAVVEWSISGAAVSAADVLDRLGLTQRFVDHVVHDFKVEDRYFIGHPRLFEQLDGAIAELPGGFILLEGPPGSGKSTYLTMYRRERPGVKFAYYCFIPNETALGNPRLERDTFLKSLCVGIQNSFPDVELPQLYSEDYEGKLRQWLYRLSELGEKIVFVVDGLDHVDKKSDHLRQPLTHYLDGVLPENIFFLLSSQYPEALSTDIQSQISRETLRHIKIGRFSEGEIQSFLERRGVVVSDEAFPLVVNRSEGIPLYLYYIALLVHDTPVYAQERMLEALPNLVNGEINIYHEFLYEHVLKNEVAVKALAILAHRREFTRDATLVQLLSLLGTKRDIHKVEETLQGLDHLLKISDANSYTIFHNSFREFILKKTGHLTDAINTALVSYYQQNPHDDETYRHFYRHLFELGLYQEILSDCDGRWLERSWQAFRPFEEITGNLDLAWECAARLQSLKEFVRVAFLKQQFAVILSNLKSADYNYSSFLLNINRFGEALRRIWDGVGFLCSPGEFYRFVLDHPSRTGHLLPERIAEIGFAQFKRNAMKDEVSIRFQALALYTNWRELFEEVSSYRWRTKDDHKHTISAYDDAENERTNNSIKKKIVETLRVAKNYESLAEIAQAQDLAPTVRHRALLCSIELLLEAEEVGEAIKLAGSIDFRTLGRKQFNRLLIRLAENQCFGKLEDKIPLNYIPPQLFASLTKKDQDFGLKEELLELYDNLRVYFLQNPSGYRFYGVKASAFGLPEQGFFTALVELSKLWLDSVKGELSDSQKFERSKGILSHLNIDRELVSKAFRDHIDDSYFVGRDVDKIYSHVLTFMADHLTVVYIDEIVSYWLMLDEGPNGYKNQRTSILFAKLLEERDSTGLRSSISKLLARAETQARADEETLQLVANLLECAEAYGYCGFDEDAVRIWNELYMLGCGIGERKDYQFNQAIPVLRQAHKHHPEKSSRRLSNLLTLAHQLEGAADGRAIARAIEELIAFSSELSPALALELLFSEDDLIYRGEAIEGLAEALSESPAIDLRYVWALIKTMDKWRNYSAYDDETFPAIKHQFEVCLDRNNIELAQEIYSYARHQLLVEKEMPGRLYVLAEVCIKRGVAFLSVEDDYRDFKADREKDLEKKAQQSGGLMTRTPEVALPSFEELHQLSERDFNSFREKLDEIAREYKQIDRRRDLKNVYVEFTRILTERHESLIEDQKGLIQTNSFSLIRRFAKFKKGVLCLVDEDETGYSSRVKQLFGQLLTEVEALMFGGGSELHISDFFDHREWIDKFIARTSRSGYWFGRDILDKHLIGLIAQSSLDNLKNWEQFCRAWQSGHDLTKSLTAIAKRLRRINRAHCRELLIEALEENRDFFYLSSEELIDDLLRLLFEVDEHKAKEILLNSFTHQYKRYPQQLVYNLDKILDFADRFDEHDFYEYVYEEYESYNALLAEGLAEKECEFEWIESFPSCPLESAIVRYLLRLFDYPQVEIRKLSLSSLFGLARTDKSLLPTVLEFCRAESENINEHVLSLVFSLALIDPASVLANKQLILEMLDIPHFNIRQTVKEILLYCTAQGYRLEPTESNRVQAVNCMSHLIIPALSEGGLQKGSHFIPTVYQTSLLQKMQIFHGDDVNDEYVVDRVYTRLQHLGWTRESWMRIENATHRSHNINDNFDNIEINGPYFSDVQNVLNETLAQEIEKHRYEDEAVQAISTGFRLYDPSDAYHLTCQRPEIINWIDPEIPDDEFLEFTDVDRRFSDFLKREDDWLTLYEDGHQRLGSEMGSSKRTVYFRVIAFLVAQPLIQRVDELMQSPIPAPYSSVQNCYRFELPDVFPRGITYPLANVGIRPIIGFSENNFRGQQELSIASLLPDVIGELGLSREQDYSLNFEKQGERIVDLLSWQEAYDQDRRRQKPKSAGVALRVRRRILEAYLNDHGYAVCYIVNLRRTTDKYLPEEKMKWRRFQRIYPFNMATKV